MRRLLAALLAVFLLTATPQTARAETDSVAVAVGFFFLFVLDTAASVGGTVTGIGSLVQLNRDPPGLGWSIASIVVGVLDGLVGAITLAALVGTDAFDGAPGFWVFAGVPLFLTATNLTLGIINFSRWGSARRRPPDPEEDSEDAPEDEWSRGLAPGVTLSFSF